MSLPEEGNLIGAVGHPKVINIEVDIKEAVRCPWSRYFPERSKGRTNPLSGAEIRP